MIQSDTIKLLRECDAGIKMGVKSIDDVMHKTEDEELNRLLNKCKDEHNELDKKLQKMLCQYGDEGKDPNFIAEKMSKMKTEIKMQMNYNDSTIADLMTEGCNMGVKSLSKYLNQYKAASEESKDIAKKLIEIEDRLALDMRKYL